LGLAFLFPYVDFSVVLGLGFAGLVYAVYVSPKWLRITTRPGELRGGWLGPKLYYVASVLGVLCLFRRELHVATAAWAIFAVGDALSNFVGRRWGHGRIPYNPRKQASGSLAFWLGGSVAAWVVGLWNLPPTVILAPGTFFLACACASLACAVVESLPLPIDDNLVLPWIGAGVLWLAAV
jgi:dolichol kinase